MPGIIGGHCVMPNIDILSKLDHSEILQAIQSSNEKKIKRDSLRSKTDGPSRLEPVPHGEGFSRINVRHAE